MTNSVFLKSFAVSAACALIAACLGSFVVDGVPFSAAFIFSVLILWLCNEVWCWVLAIPTIIAAILKSAERKPFSLSSQLKLVRLTSVSLLITPHLLFAILYLVESLTKGQASQEFGIPLTNSMFITAFIGVALLWAANMVMRLVPVALEILASYIFEPELWTESTTPAELASAPAAPVPAELPEGLLYSAKPVLSVTNSYVRRHFWIGIGLMVAVLLLANMAVQFASQYMPAACLCGVLALAFGFAALHSILWPSRWRNRLSHVEYAFSCDTVYIREKGETRSFPLDENLNLTHEKIEGNVGSIYISPKGKLERAFGKLLGKGTVEVTDLQNTVDLSAPLMGFYQIENSPEVFAQLVACRDGKTQG